MCRHLALELVERAAGVRSGVHERQRLVLDQVDVDAPNGKGSRDRQAMDTGLSRRGVGVLHRAESIG